MLASGSSWISFSCSPWIYEPIDLVRIESKQGRMDISQGGAIFRGVVDGS